MSFFGKIFTWFANEHLVKFLAKNRTFQQGALKIDSFINANKEIVTKSGEEYMKKGSTIFQEQSSKVHEAATSRMGFDAYKFATAFKDEVMKDVSQISKKK
jgi:hypothetical protein